jgi:hypothetical protein
MMPPRQPRGRLMSLGLALPINASAQSSSTMPTTAPTGIGTSPNLFTLRPDPGCRS